MDEVRTYWQVANISYFCTLFRRTFRLPGFDFQDLEIAFATPVPDYKDVIDLESEDLDDFHLLVKISIPLLKAHYSSRISYANWENYLRKFLDKYYEETENKRSPFRVPLLSQDGVELTKNLTFNEIPLGEKIEIINSLCDYRLRCDDAVDALKEFSADDLRLENIGEDSNGYIYWYFCGTRLYREDRAVSNEILRRTYRTDVLKFRLLQLEKQRIFKEQEERRLAKQLLAKQLAAEAREQSLKIKREQEQEEEKKHKSKKQKSLTPRAGVRTGLRERRSTSTGGNSLNPTSSAPIQNGDKNAHNNKKKEPPPSPGPKKTPEEECREELENNIITLEDRSAAWSVVCDSPEEWEAFAEALGKSKQRPDKILFNLVQEELLPRVHGIHSRKIQEIRRREKELILSLMPRRVSSRTVCKKIPLEEDYILT